jgi:hypothetical protein
MSYEGVIKLAERHPTGSGSVDWMNVVVACYEEASRRPTVSFPGSRIVKRTGWIPGLTMLARFGILEKDGESSRGGDRAYWRMQDLGGCGEALRELGYLETSTSSGIDTEEATTTVVQALEEMFSVIPQLTGEALPADFAVDRVEITKMLSKVEPVVSEIEIAANIFAETGDLAAYYSVIERLLGLLIEDEPQTENVLETWARRIEDMAKIPENLSLPEGVDYDGKHQNLRCLIHELHSAGEGEAIESFFELHPRQRRCVKYTDPTNEFTDGSAIRL